MVEEVLKIRYDRQQDILYMHFKDGPVQTVKEVEENVIVELDNKDEVMGIELWGAGRRGLLKQLTKLVVPH